MYIRKIRQRTQSASCELDLEFPKLNQILACRGINNKEQLDYQLKHLIPPNEMLNINVAAEAILEAIKSEKNILIIGDFDCDGATSTAVMIKALRMMGAKYVDFLVPDRFAFGYGLSVKLVDFAASLAAKPDIIVTVDNGISNVEGVAKAKAHGIPVIVTDHHLAGEVLPEALAIVNPNQPNDTFPSKNIAGVGVAFYLMLALRNLMRQTGWFESQQIFEPNLAELLDIVALGTVADVVVLDRNNRILVEQGLRRIRSGLVCPGIEAILQVARRDITKVVASDLGFAVGPRLNAAGRLDDMRKGIECLLAESVQQALPLASELDRLNRSRRDIEGEMLQQASTDLEAFLITSDQFEDVDKRPLSMCLYDPKWHQGVIGILASRVKDKLNRPTVVFADDTDSNGELIKGSARSVKGVHIRDALALIDSKCPALIEKFGGHAMAAGLSIRTENFQQFSDELVGAVEYLLQGEIITDEIVTDGHLSKNEFSLSFAQALKNIGPWGQGFPEPLFDDEFIVVNSRQIGEEHLKLVLEKSDVMVDAIYFRCPENQWVVAGDKARVVYKLDINEFRGERNLQLMIEQIEKL